ncbi:MAG: MmgE/PrpD family protein [Pseudomonadota bacterium]
MSITRRLTAFALDTKPDALDDAMLRTGRLCLADWAAVARAGAHEPVCYVVRDMATAEGGREQAGTVHGDTLPARLAAFVNATAGHALDYDDTHFLHIGHVTTVVAPAALAVGEQVEASTGDVATAYLIGAEAACRIGDWLGRAHYNAGYHQTATAGVFGATLAAARLMTLSRAATLSAMGLASTRAAGLKAQFGTMGKPLNAGFAAMAGVECAMLAAMGAASVSDGLEAAQGFAATHAAAAPIDPTGAAALDGLGEAWVFPAVSYKLHACCHGIHAALEALRVLIADGIEPAAVEAVELTVNPCWQTVCAKPDPKTGLEAKFSYAQAVAMALSGIDTAALASFSDVLCARPDLVALRSRVGVGYDASIADTAARVVLRMAGGRVAEASHDLRDPEPVDQISQRVRAKARTLIGEEAEASIWAALSKAAADEAVTGFAGLLACKRPRPGRMSA